MSEKLDSPETTETPTLQEEPIGMKTLASVLTRTFREWNVPIVAIALALGLVLCSTAALAQSGAGSIQGTVTDPPAR
jgi:ABC-type sulfate transport system permease subunit